MKLPTDAADAVSVTAAPAPAVGSDAAEPAAPPWYLPAVVAATAVALLNGLIGIGANSVARDEGFSISTSLRSWSSLARLSVHTETNAWLYAVVLKVWSSLGTTPGVLRLPSVLAFVTIVPLGAGVARRLFGPRVAVITAGLLALNGSLLMFSQQIRVYTFAVAAALAATAVFVADVRRPRRSTLVGWVVLVALTAQFQLHTITVCLPHLAALGALAPGQRQWRRRIGALAVGLVIVAPVPVAISTHEEGQGLFSLRLGVFRDVLYTFTGRGGMPGIVAFVAGGAGVLALAWHARRAEPAGWRRFGLVLLVGWIAVPFLVMLAGSLALQPTLIGRYLLFCVPAVVMALAILVDRLVVTRARRPLALAAAALLVLGAARGSLSWHVDSHTEHWNEVAAYVFDHASADDRIVLANDSVRLFFEYERRRRTVAPAGPQPGYPVVPWGAYGTGDQRYESPSPDELAAAAAGPGRLWVVIGHKHVNTDVMTGRLSALGPGWRLVERRSFPVEIDVLVYERVAP